MHCTVGPDERIADSMASMCGSVCMLSKRTHATAVPMSVASCSCGSCAAMSCVAVALRAATADDKSSALGGSIDSAACKRGNQSRAGHHTLSKLSTYTLST